MLRTVRILPLLLVIAAAATLQAQTFTDVATGLDNPRGLAFGPEGALYVTEAGRGGAGPCFLVRGVQFCTGTSGAITRVWKGVQERIVTGLPSYARLVDGGEASGPQRISFQGRGNAFVTIGLARNPSTRSDGSMGDVGPGFGQLVKFDASGGLHKVADIGAYEAANNPDAVVPPDSNPFGLLALAGGQLLTDAGGNDLLYIAADQTVSLLAVFPARQLGTRLMQAVPTSISIGPDGAIYVGQLTGNPFPVGGANVYRVVPGSDPTVFASGFTNIIDIAWGPDGNLYVLEIAEHGLLANDKIGALIRVSPDGATKALVTDNLYVPTALAIGSDGSFYVTSCGDCAGVGKVVKIEPYAAAVP